MSVDLVPEWTIGDLSLTSYPYGVDADSTVDIGEPEMVVESVESLLGDGDLERVSRHGNRTYVLEVYVEGPTLAEVATSEAALRSELRRAGLSLTHNPGDGFSPTSVYLVHTAKLTPQRRDDHESHLVRKFTLTLTCAPFARSVEATLIEPLFPAAPPVPSTVVEDTVTSTSGWVVEGGDLLSFDAANGAVRTTITGALPAGAATTVTLTRPALIDTSVRDYLVIDWSLQASTPSAATVRLLTGGAPVTELYRLFRGTYSSGTWFRSWYKVGVGQLSSGFSLQMYDVGGPNAGPSLSIAEVSLTTDPPGTSTRQLTRTLEVGGTERTAASLRVASEAGDLGHTLVAAWPEESSGFAPPMRRWRAAGNTVNVNSGAISGASEAIGPTAVSFGVPSSSIPPGAYQLVGRLRTVGATGSLNIYWEAGTSVQDVMLAGSVSGSVDWPFPAVGEWEIVPLGTLVLPVIAATAGDLVIGINHAGSAQLEYDELWLFPVGEDCSIAGAQVGATRLWIDAPEVGASASSLRIGNTDDRSNARSPGLSTIGKDAMTLQPGRMSLFVASEIEYPVLDGSYFMNWHSNAAE